jgi:hypothetical protein
LLSPRAWAGSVNGSTGVAGSSVGVTSITRTGAGVYAVVIPALADTNYGVSVSVDLNGRAIHHFISSKTTTGFTINVTTDSGDARPTFRRRLTRRPSPSAFGDKAH